MSNLLLATENAVQYITFMLVSEISFKNTKYSTINLLIENINLNKNLMRYNRISADMYLNDLLLWLFTSYWCTYYGSVF